MPTNHRHSEDEPTRTLAGGSDMLEPGTVLAGRYRIVEVAGAGGMGVVYRAHDEQLDIDVAVKLLHGGRRVDTGALERFRREVLLSRQVSHANVVRIHDIGRDGDAVFLSMDYVPGRTLRERMAEGRLSPEQAVDITRQLADALAAAHREGVVHRDIKPGNVMVDERGRAWLADFGIARSLSEEGLTLDGEVVGTLDYLAPEQVRGDPVDGRCDIYALGLLLWEMLTGKVPLTGETREETMARRASGRLPASLPGSQGVPRRLRAIARRCLASNPDDRYEDAQSLSADLARGRAGLDRRRWARYAAALLAVTAIAALWYWRPPSEPETAASAAAPQRIAVLPLINATGDESHDWVRRGLSENIAVALAENPAVQVVESIRVFRSLEDLRLAPEELNERALGQLGELFNAGALVGGRLIGGGADLRLDFRLFGRGGELDRRFQIRTNRESLLSDADQAVTEVLAGLELPAPEPGRAPPLSADPAALSAFDRGVARLARGERAGAIAELEDAIDADPEFGTAWLRLTDAYREAGYYDQAVDAADHAVELLGERGGRYGLWAQARQAALSGDPARALDLFERLVESYPQDVDARLARGELLGDLGRLDEAIEALRQVTGDDPQHPRAWFLLGKFAILSGDARTAVEDWLVRALVIQNRLGNDEGRAEVFNALGIANEQLGMLAAATENYGEAARLRAAVGDRRGEAGSLANLARLNMIEGNYEAARKDLERAMALRREIGDLAGVADLLNEFGVLEEDVGDYPAALEHYREALRLRTEMGGGRGLAESHLNLAFAFMMLGEYDNAEVFSGRAHAEHEEAGNLEGQMSSRLIQGELHLARGDWDAAQGAFLEALELSRTLGNPFGEATAEGAIGKLAQFQGRPAAALDAYAKALEILEPLGDTRGLAEYHLRRAELLLELYLHEPARADLEAVRGWMGDGGNLAQRAMLTRLEAELLAANGDHARAGSDFDQAAELARAAGSVAEQLRVDAARLRWLDQSPEFGRELATAAARLGNRPLRLEILGRLAESQLAAGQAEAAHATLRDALRPPLALSPWSGNWHLHWLMSRAEQATGQGDGSAAAARARELFQSQTAGLPEAWREGLLDHPHAELLDVVAS